MPRRLTRLLTLVLAALVWAYGAAAQDTATLIADRVSVLSGSVLVAEGHVEVFFQGQHLTASAITYDQKADRLTITGPIRIDDGKGSVFFAEAADLSADMTEGLLTSARLVLSRQLQLTAAEISRSQGGNLTAMRSVAASSCTICKGNPTPLWEIRARQVVHDAAAQQIYFSDATLRFYGVPVSYLPMLRVPDPTLERATGFLFPKLESSTALGTGLKLPYFIVMGDSRDLTLTPYLTVLGDRTVNLSYRQALAYGDLAIKGAVTRDHLLPGEWRGYIGATGAFDLGNEYRLSFEGLGVSDPAYLSDYGISTTDQLLNQIELGRLHRDLSFSAQLIGLHTLREGESHRTLPTAIADLSYERRFSLPVLEGVAALRLDTHGDYRSSTSSSDSDGDGEADGRDLSRASLSFNWRRTWITPGGLEISALTDARLDSYSIAQDAVFEGSPERLSGAVGLELRWPLVKAGPSGRTQMIEPVAQLVVASQPKSSIPNGDSTLVEFDEASLFSLDRFPGADAVEDGARLNLGVSYTLQDPKGWSLGLTLGRVVQVKDAGQFSNNSGFQGLRSDWLLAWSLADQDGLRLTNRLVVDDSLSLTKAEMRFDVTNNFMTLSGGYEYLLADADEGRTATASEIMLNAGRDLTPNWSANLSSRYDLRAARLANAGLELDFHNECIDVTLSLSRRYASSTSVRPSTDFGLTVELLGFGGGSKAGPARTCRR